MPSKPTFADLLNDLIATRRDENDKEYNNSDIARALGCDASYVAKLRKGAISNPGRDTLLGLCEFFSVPPDYFFPQLHPDAPTPQQQVDLALRSMGLDTEEQSLIRNLIRKLKG